MQFENVVFPDSVGFKCRNCGVCCRDQPPDISFKEQQRIEDAGYTDFMMNPSEPNNRNLRRTEDGSCIFFTKENTCKIHAIKPSICILEPFVITDIECRTNRIFLGLNPLATANCKGIFGTENYAYKEAGKAAQAIVADFSDLLAERLGLPVTDERVVSLTRKLLRDSNST